MPVFLSELNFSSTFIRLLLAFICGGILGIERGRKNRPAGFRTYMLVCVGSALVMITNQYICDMYQGVDPSRMGAQVVSGIGFLGAGTIIVTARNRVKGLTTAAGLWVAACVGLSIGIGFYIGAIIGCLMTLFVMAVLHNLDNRVTASSKAMDLYIEFAQLSFVGSFIKYAKSSNMKISNLEVTNLEFGGKTQIAVLLTIRLEKKQMHTDIIHLLGNAEGVCFIEEV
jgi:putative Mg2+ transporter-C (MgtC) family protein